MQILAEVFVARAQLDIGENKDWRLAHCLEQITTIFQTITIISCNLYPLTSLSEYSHGKVPRLHDSNQLQF